MAGTVYTVTVKYNTVGKLPNQTLGGSGGLVKLGSAAETLGDGLLSALGTAAKITAEFTAMAGAAAVGGVIFGLTQVNSKLEETQIALGAIFTGNGFTKNLEEGLDHASGIMKLMRKDAAALPGELEDLSGIFKSILPQGASLGMSTKEIEKFSAQTMVLGEVLAGGNFKLAGREMAKMMSGHATGVMPLFNNLGTGLDTKSFNALKPEERLKLLKKRADEVASPEVIERYKTSWVGLFSTLKDNFKTFAGATTGPLFDSIKKAMARVSSVIVDDNNNLTPRFQKIADKIGYYLKAAFEKATNFIERWWGPVSTFIDNLRGELTQIWDSVSDKVAGIGEIIKNWLVNPESAGNLISDIKTIFEMALALKGGGALASAVGSIGPLMKGASGIVEGVGIAGLSGLIVAGSILAISADAYFQGVASAMGRDPNDPVRKKMEGFDKQYETSKANLLASIGVNDEYAESTTKAATASEEFAMTLKAAGAIALDFGSKLISYSGGAANGPFNMGDRGIAPHIRIGEVTREHYEPFGPPTPTAEDKLADLRAKNNTPPKHDTTIHKVEIVVNSNQDPSRIARLTVEQLANLARNPISTTSQKFTDKPR